jgi:hypothetical protein
MDNRKFEQLIDLIINENEEQAKALFHDIVVEKSREIYESMMDEELEEGYTVTVEETPGGGADQVGDMMDEVDGDMTGQMAEDDDEFADIEGGDDEFGTDDDMGGDDDMDMGGDDDMDMGGEEDLEDRVVDLEDKLDELMAEFEELMGSEGGDDDMGGEEDFGASDDEEGGEEGEEEELDENLYVEKTPESELEESVQLKKVPGLYGSNIGGDNGVNTKSVALTKPKIIQTGAKPIALGSQEAGKGGTQGGLLKPTSKTIPGTYKNAPGGKNFSDKGESVAKPANGKGGESQNNKSIVGESRKSTKQIIKKR